MKFFFVATAVVLRTFFGWVLCCCCNEPKASMAFAANDDVMHHMQYIREKVEDVAFWAYTDEDNGDDG